MLLCGKTLLLNIFMTNMKPPDSQTEAEIRTTAQECDARMLKNVTDAGNKIIRQFAVFSRQLVIEPIKDALSGISRGLLTANRRLFIPFSNFSPDLLSQL
jgi:phage terminase Nu1 subunit (DNA packaging protein)